MARATPDHRTRSILIVLLKNVRRAYIALHEGTDSAPTAFSSSRTDRRGCSISTILLSPDAISPAISRALRYMCVTRSLMRQLALTSSAPQPIVLPAPQSSHAPETPPDSSLTATDFLLLHGTHVRIRHPPVQHKVAADASIMTSTSSLVPIARSTQTATTTLTFASPLVVAFCSPYSGKPRINHPLSHSVTQVPRLTMPAMLPSTRAMSQDATSLK
jgi:hypothetical protein